MWKDSIVVFESHRDNWMGIKVQNKYIKKEVSWMGKEGEVESTVVGWSW